MSKYAFKLTLNGTLWLGYRKPMGLVLWSRDKTVKIFDPVTLSYLREAYRKGNEAFAEVIAVLVK